MFVKTLLLAVALLGFFSVTSAMSVSAASKIGNAINAPTITQAQHMSFTSGSKAVKANLIERLLDAKAQSGVSFDEIADKLGLTNAYVANLFTNQAQLKAETAPKLKALVPTISDEDIQLMQRVPFRCYDPELQQEPFVYRLIEAINHYGDGLKLLANEKCGDGIISAIDFYVTMDQVKGTNGEDRLVVSLNGKFLPHIEQRSENNTFKPQA